MSNLPILQGTANLIEQETNNSETFVDADQGTSSGHKNTIDAVKPEILPRQICKSSLSLEETNSIPTNQTSSGYLSSEQSRATDQGGSKDLEDIEAFCRICHEVENNETFVSPCRCKGSIASVHRECIERWLAERDTNHCEICGFQYNTVRVPKYSLLSAAYVWLTSPDTQRERRELVFDILGVTIFAPLASTGTYVGFLLAEVIENEPPPIDDNDVSLGQMVLNASGRMAMLTIISLLITVDVAYATWIVIRMQNHVTNWYTWYRRNSVVTLLPTAGCAT